MPDLALSSPPGTLKELTGTVGSCVGCWPGELVQLSKWTEAPHGAKEVVGAGGLGVWGGRWGHPVRWM